MVIVQEGKTKIEVSSEKKISKKLPVFYNPVMKLNRDISVLLLNSVDNKQMQIALPMVGSGIRGLRFLYELKKGKLKTLFLNDYKEDFYEVLKNNFSLNESFNGEIIVSNDDANSFLLESSGFDYIDIDPFGTPNPFLDSAVKRISRNGVLAVTATDTSALCGTYENACKRKYWAKPLRNELKHEVGLRILIRKVQLVAAQYEKALTPIFSYSRDHYMRVFFKCEKGKTKVDELLKLHDFFCGAGPVWLGSLWDVKLVQHLLKIAPFDLKKFLELILSEAKIGVAGFYDIHEICKKERLPIPKFYLLMEQIKKKGFQVSRTHFSELGLRSGVKKEDLIKLIQSLV
ncbi:MAG: tRNA (guanine(26)-N(2))-dimethyltransferase [Nanoarchaeota archaeon]|nr:tRNA (guanine(26)-N(2))-dimethyltransferase [Nanoarchaeota archaeon]MBU1030493.1 tRNA (guanine(26)-N(2))-dimethyltransferase [Nanoarchaeota archaeon]MBU1850610.1 tRNA (guanine(26)-N(2))-dimethyltransferase [Nanoarchaeota archaeon]